MQLLCQGDTAETGDTCLGTLGIEHIRDQQTVLRVQSGDGLPPGEWSTPIFGLTVGKWRQLLEQIQESGW